jgi:hypothetical protein
MVIDVQEIWSFWGKGEMGCSRCEVGQMAVAELLLRAEVGKDGRARVPVGRGYGGFRS